VRELLTSLRPQFWVFSVVPGVSGVWLAMGSFPLRQTVLVVVLLASGAALAEVVNDHVDRHSDLAQRVKKLGPVAISGGSGVAHTGGVTTSAVVVCGCVLACIVVVLSVVLGRRVTGLSMIGLVLALGYSLRPLRLKFRGVWGLSAMAVGRGLVSFHIGWTAFSAVTATSLAVGMFLSLLCFGTALVSYLADFPEDNQLGILTFPVQVGFQRAAQIGAGAALASLLVLTSARISLGLPMNFLTLPFALMVLALAWLTARAHASDIRSVSRLQVFGMLTFLMGALVPL
jgi:4-hydroxybenzoate polyprenyltransferase